MTATRRWWDPIPRSVGGVAEAVAGARGDARKLKRIFERSPVPTFMVDAQRRHIEANRPARLWFGRSLQEMRAHAMDDLAPPDERGFVESLWARLLETGFVADRYQRTKPDGRPIDVVYSAIADVLPGRHVVVFAPVWLEDELGVIEGDGPNPSASLTPREIEVLALAAEGAGTPELSVELALSPDTVRTHLKHIYAKLGVHNRTGAVTRAIRLGLIDC